MAFTKRPDAFKFRLCDDERKMLLIIAARLERSQSDAVRVLIRREAAREFADEHAPDRDARTEGERCAYLTN